MAIGDVLPQDNRSILYSVESILTDAIVNKMIKMNILSPYEPICPTPTNNQLHQYNLESKQEDIPSTTDILSFIPERYRIPELQSIPGIFSFSSFIPPNGASSFDNLLSMFSNEKKKEEFNTAQIMSSIVNVYGSYFWHAIHSYYMFVKKHPYTVLQGLIKAVMIVISTHRSTVDRILSPVFNSDVYYNKVTGQNMLWNITFEALQKINYESKLLSDEPNLDGVADSIRLVNQFRSPNYDLKPYFHLELQFLQTLAPTVFALAENIINRTINERLQIDIRTKGIRTKTPTTCIKLMPLLVRKLFSGLLPCVNTNLYKAVGVSKYNHANSPIISFSTSSNRQTLTRIHGEVHDAICTLWAAGNEVLSDLMIARTIWPRSSCHGCDRFSSEELNTINQAVHDLQAAQIKIDASNELRHYKKIGPEDRWVLEDNILAAEEIYTRLNGCKYVQKAYKLLRTPVLLTYATELAQIFSVPISMLATNNRTPHTLRCAQIRSYILERIHHFMSPSYRNKTNIILMKNIYRVYGLENATEDIKKKARCKARNTAVSYLEMLKQNNLISDFYVCKSGGVYRHIQIITSKTTKHNN